MNVTNLRTATVLSIANQASRCTIAPRTAPPFIKHNQRARSAAQVAFQDIDEHTSAFDAVSRLATDSMPTPFQPQAERTLYWQHIGVWKDVREDEFLSYRWQVSYSKPQVVVWIANPLRLQIQSIGKTDWSIS